MSPRVVLLAATLLAAAPLRAGNRLFLAGGEVAEDAHYAYAGVILPLGRWVDQGWRQRWWVDHVGYEYDGGPGRIEARAPERTDTRRGFLGSPNRDPIAFSTFFSAAFTSPASDLG